MLAANTLSYVNAQGSEVIVSGSNFNVFVNGTGGLAFQHTLKDRTFTIEVLSGVWNGTDCTLGMTLRGGKLYFYSNEAVSVQLSHNNEFGMRLTYEGISLTKLDDGKSWNGTFASGTESYLNWSFALTMVHETYFMLGIGILGIILMFAGFMMSAAAVRKYGMDVFDKEILVFTVPALIIGFGFVVIWLWGS